MTKKKVFLVLMMLLLVLAGLYFAGPKPPPFLADTVLPDLSMSPVETERALRERERQFTNIKPGNEGAIIWNDSISKAKTEYCIVYLHGFSASPMEGDPVHKDMAKKYGCNLYLPRLLGHGMNEQEPLVNLTADDYIMSAKIAVAEAKNLGRKVIVMGTSTGATLALYIASGNPDIAGLILYSPNIDLFDSRSFILTMPWGLQLARMTVGDKYYTFKGPEGVELYWTTRYRIEALIAVKSILQNTMKKETFQKIKQPVLLCYYYKNEEEQDDVVSVPAMLKMYDQLGTAESLKAKIAFPNVGNHALVSGIWSKDVLSVERETARFFSEVLRVSKQFDN